MKCLKRLNDVFPLAITGHGIFDSMNQIQTLPFPVSPLIMDIEYFGNVSGNKIVSPLIDRVVSDEEITPTEENTLSNVIISMYYKKWEKLYDTFELEYNPIQNYDMEETMTNDETVHEYGKTVQRTDNLTHAKTGTETQTDNLTEQRTDNLSAQRTDNLSKSVDRSVTETHNTTETETPNLTNNTNNKIFGFNSSVGVDSDSQEMTSTGTTTNAKTGTVTTDTDETENNTGTQTTLNTGTQTNAKTGTVTTDTDETENNTGTQTTLNTGTQTNNKTGTIEMSHNVTDRDTGTQNTATGGTDTDTRNYTLRRSGNIGVTTSQQMIQAERDLWLWDFFHTVVFPDVDKVLTIPIY